MTHETKENIGPVEYIYAFYLSLKNVGLQIVLLFLHIVS